MTVEQWLGNDNKIGIDIWHKKYQRNNETFDEWIDRVSAGNEKVANLIRQKKFLFGGRTLANRGIDNEGSYFNCYSRGFVEDDYKDIMQACVDIGLTFKSQGGQGISLSKIRPKGTPVGNEYTSDGIVPFMKIYNEVTAGTSQGGCIDEDELVLSNNGLKKISEVNIGDKVWTRKGFIPVNYVYDKGKQDVYKVTTALGHSITTTKDHKFFIGNNNVKHLNELNVGDCVVIMNGEYEPNDIVLDAKAYFIGAYMCDGYIPKKLDGGMFKGDSTKIPTANKIIECLDELGYKAWFRKTPDEKTPYFELAISSETAKWVNEIGCKKDNAYNTFIPDFVMNGDYATRLSFVCGCLDTDGSKNETSFHFDTASETFAHQFVILLQSLGFTPSIHVAERESPRSNIYRIHTSVFENSPNLEFCSRIKIDKKAKNSRKTTPYSIESLEWEDRRTGHLTKLNKKTNIGYYTYIKEYNKEEDDVPSYYDKIVSIEKLSEPHHVYDISLESEHFFWCNGIYVSNSRKGALMLSIDARHKEAETFIKIKSENGIIEKANLSLEIDDEFMRAVEKYYLTGEIVTLHEHREYSSHAIDYDIVPINIFNAIVDNCYDWGDPACLFTNRFRNYNIMQYVDEYQIETSNPCKP